MVVKLWKVPDDGDQQVNHDDVAQVGQGDIAKTLQGGSAVDDRRFNDVGGDGLQGSQQDDHVEEETTYEMFYQDDLEKRSLGVADPGDEVGDDAQAVEDVVEHAILLVEDPLPEQGWDHSRHNPGGEQHRTEQVAGDDGLVQHNGGKKTQQELPGDGADDEDDRGDPYLVVSQTGEQCLEIIQSDPRDACGQVHQAIRGEAQVNAAQQRVQHGEGQDGKGRKEKKKRELRIGQAEAFGALPGGFYGLINSHGERTFPGRLTVTICPMWDCRGDLRVTPAG